ncbi:MAG TPA: hypothetical protein VGG39_03630 [Polyangiaceae bacterium]
MHWPYSLDFTDSYLIAQSCACLLLTALLLFARAPSWAVRGTMLVAIWLAGISVAVGPAVATLGYKPPLDTFLHLLAGAALLGTAACVLARRPVVAILALFGQIPLWMVAHFVKESDGEVAGLTLAWLGLLAGLLLRSPRPRTSEGPRAPRDDAYATHDTIVFFASTALAALVCVVVMHRQDGAADEWGYTYQAAVFAKGHLYAAAPRCETYLEHMYVFESTGKLFSQYTPGWPLFITPFVWIHAVWLSGPVSLGIFAAGMARLGRSATRAFGRDDEPAPERVVRAAGTWAAALATIGPMVLVNGASRYPHVFVCGMFAWTLEAVLVIASPGLSRRNQIEWGALLGTVAVFDVAARPADGAFVSAGAALVLLYFCARRQVGWRAFVAAAAATAFWSLIMLVILRAQLGKWFVTGYSLNASLHPWNVVKYAKPTPSQWKYGLPLATSAYCWWPCSASLGLAGLALLRGKARSLWFAFALGCLPYVAYMEYLDLGQRGYDWGWGPRYLMVLIVPFALGAAVALAPLTVAAFERRASGRSALARGGPFALAVFAVVSGWVRIVPLVWPTAADQTRRHSALARAAKAAGIHDAVVIAAPGTEGFQDIDLPTNLPLDLYPDQDVILASDRQQPHEAATCLRAEFPDRKIYVASGVGEVRILPSPY